MINALLEEEANIKTGRAAILELFSVPRNRRAALASGIVMFMQQFCGINVIGESSPPEISMSELTPCEQPTILRPFSARPGSPRYRPWVPLLDSVRSTGSPLRRLSGRSTVSFGDASLSVLNQHAHSFLPLASFRTSHLTTCVRAYGGETRHLPRNSPRDSPNYSLTLQKSSYFSQNLPLDGAFPIYHRFRLLYIRRKQSKPISPCPRLTGDEKASF